MEYGRTKFTNRSLVAVTTQLGLIATIQISWSHKVH